MKITTDACAFGAFVANLLQEYAFHPAIVVDVGTGTGLLALMLAQQLHPPFRILALEMDEAACAQAQENFAASPWQPHLQAIHADVRRWTCQQPAELIISNPPFFHGQLASANDKKALAFHDQALNLEELLCFANEHLAVAGWLAVLLPQQRRQEFCHLALRRGFHLLGECQMYAHAHKQKPHVVAGIFSRQPTIPRRIKLVYRDEQGNETPLFRKWLSPYYLYL
ncbi:MAG: methyltransferase [Thermoflavifilum sp.]|nr:methyltransferase [Thermoflavifilum sp.]